MEIKEITLLSKEEFESCKEFIKPFEGWWWLRSPGRRCNALCVASQNNFYGASGLIVDKTFVSVRPALRIDPDSSGITPGKEIQLAGQTWTAVSGSLMLCDQEITKMGFRDDWQAPDANCYDTSDVRKYLESWAMDRGIIEQEINTATILYDNDTTRNAKRVQRLKGIPTTSMDTEDLRYMAPFVCPAKTEYDIRKNPYIKELCKRAGTLDKLMSDDKETQKSAVDGAYKKFGSCLVQGHKKKHR